MACYVRLLDSSSRECLGSFTYDADAADEDDINRREALCNAVDSRVQEVLHDPNSYRSAIFNSTGFAHDKARLCTVIRRDQPENSEQNPFEVYMQRREARQQAPETVRKQQRERSYGRTPDAKKRSQRKTNKEAGIPEGANELITGRCRVNLDVDDRGCWKPWGDQHEALQQTLLHELKIGTREVVNGTCRTLPEKKLKSLICNKIKGMRTKFRKGSSNAKDVWSNSRQHAKERRERIKRMWEERHGGVTNTLALPSPAAAIAPQTVSATPNSSQHNVSALSQPENYHASGDDSENIHDDASMHDEDNIDADDAYTIAREQSMLAPKGTPTPLSTSIETPHVPEVVQNHDAAIDLGYDADATANADLFDGDHNPLASSDDDLGGRVNHVAINAVIAYAATHAKKPKGTKGAAKEVNQEDLEQSKMKVASYIDSITDNSEMIEKVKAMEQDKCNTKNVMLELFEFTIVGDSRFYKEYTNQLRKLRTSLSNAGVSINTAEVVAAPVDAEEEEDTHDGYGGDGACVKSGDELHYVEVHEQPVLEDDKGKLHFWILDSKSKRMRNDELGKGRYSHKLGFYFRRSSEVHDVTYEVASGAAETDVGWYPTSTFSSP